MVDDRRVYRVSLWFVLWLLFALVAFGVVLLGRLRGTGVEGAGLVWTGVVWVACGALLLAGVWRSVTVVTWAGVEVRGLFRTRLHQWPEIAEIQENQLGAVVIFDHALQRVELPNVHRKRLGDAFVLELGFLTAQWQARRGPGWRSRAAELAQQAADIRQEAERSQGVANIVVATVIAGLLGFLGSMVLLVVVDVISESVEGNLLNELLPWIMLAMPVVASVLVAAIGVAWRRARMRR